MKKEDLFDALGDINEEYIKEAHMDNKKRKIKEAVILLRVFCH